MLAYLLSDALGDFDELIENGIRLKFVGDLEFFGAKMVARMRRAEEKTGGGDAMLLNVALNYGGRWDIAQAVSRLPPAAGQWDDEQLQREIAGRLQVRESDLLIRTGGHARISNFLLWQLSYAELYFTDTLWPDFDQAAFQRALDWFAQCRRKFGKTPAQLKRGRAG